MMQRYLPFARMSHDVCSGIFFIDEKGLTIPIEVDDTACSAKLLSPTAFYPSSLRSETQDP
jgi:hypothetical protein